MFLNASIFMTNCHYIQWSPFFHHDVASKRIRGTSLTGLKNATFCQSLSESKWKSTGAPNRPDLGPGCPDSHVTLRETKVFLPRTTLGQLGQAFGELVGFLGSSQWSCTVWNRMISWRSVILQVLTLALFGGDFSDWKEPDHGESKENEQSQQR